MSSGVTRAVVRAGDRTTCRSYVSDDLSFGEGANDVSFQLPDDRSFGPTEFVFFINQNDAVLLKSSSCSGLPFSSSSSSASSFSPEFLSLSHLSLTSRPSLLLSSLPRRPATSPEVFSLSLSSFFSVYFLHFVNMGPNEKLNF